MPDVLGQDTVLGPEGGLRLDPARQDPLKSLTSKCGKSRQESEQCILFNTILQQLLVSCGGGRRPADGLRKQHVGTIRLLVWDTLEDFFAIGTSYVGRRRHVTRMHVDEGRTN